MRTALIWIARLAGLLGAAFIASAALARFGGTFWVAGFQISTLLQGGMALVLLACLAYLAVLAERPPR